VPEGAEARARALGLEIPDFVRDGYYGAGYGSMKSHHQVGSLLFLSGHVPELPDGTSLHPGRLGRDVTVEQGYAAARQTGLNCLAGIRLAVGSLDRMVAIVRSLNFVVCVPEFTDVHLVSSGATDLFRDVFGEEAGLGGRATIGVVSLAGNACFENWLTVEVDAGP
jgi:enamine deaminase RidA (YjgF/YER057c/UK114 family)